MRRALPAAAFALVALLLAWPILDGGLLGARSIDGLGSWWFQWWVAQGMGEPEIFHPYGKDVLAHTGANLVDALVSVPLRWVFGPSGAWNLLALGILLSNGGAAYALARHRFSANAALIAAVVAALHPYALFEISSGRPTQAMLAPAILALAFFDRGGVRLLAASAVALAFAGYVYWFGGLFTGLALVVLALARPRKLHHAAAVAVGAVVLCLPLAIPLLMRLAADEIPGVLPVETWWTAIDLRTTQGDEIPLCTLSATDILSVRMDTTKVLGALGLAALVLAGLSGGAGRRWALVAALSVLLAIGPRPMDLPNPVYLLLTLIPGVDRLYWPCRALSLLLPTSALGAAWLAERWRFAGPSLVAVLVLELGVRELLPLPEWSPEVPAAITCIASAPDEGAVIDLPYARDHEPLLYQTVHERPILDGMNPRSKGQVPSELRSLREDNSWTGALIVAARNPRDESSWTAEDKSAMEALGYRWVVLRLSPIQSELPEAVRSLHLRALRGRLEDLAGAPVFEDEDTWVFAPWGGEVCPS